MYEITITALVVIGLIASGVYVTTWLPGAVRARRRNHTTLSSLEIVDFAALPGACFLILLLNAFNIWEAGIPTPGTPGLAAQRIAALVLIVAIVLLRLGRWTYTYFSTPKGERRDGALRADIRQNGAS